MAENPLTLKGFISGWLQQFFSEPFNPLNVMLAMRSKLMLDAIDEMGRSYNLLRGIGYGFIDMGEIPGETPGNPDLYYPPNINIFIIVTPIPGLPGPGEPGYVPPVPGQPGYVPPGPGEPGYIPPAPAYPGPYSWPSWWRWRYSAEYMSPPSGFAGDGTGLGLPPSGSKYYNRMDCCVDKDNPLIYIHIGYTTLDMICGETQDFTIEGYDPTCPASKYTWDIDPASGSTDPPVDYGCHYTAPDGGSGCLQPVTLNLYCTGLPVDSVVINVDPKPLTATISYTTLGMQINETQTLTAVPGVLGCGPIVYDWVIVSGGGSLNASQGTSVIYTAPASNASCANNATIRLSISGTTMDTIVIAINGVIGATNAGRRCVEYVYGQSCLAYLYCRGDWYPSDSTCQAALGANAGYHVAHTCEYYPYPHSVLEDIRTPALILAGCCPKELM